MARKKIKGTNWRIAGGIFLIEVVITPDGLVVEGPLNAQKKRHRHGDVTVRLSVDLSSVHGRSLRPRQLSALRRHLRASVKAAQEAIDTSESNGG